MLLSIQRQKQITKTSTANTLDIVGNMHSPGLGLFLSFFFSLLLFRASPMAYGSFQARGRMRATAAGLHGSHHNAGSEPCL